MEQQEKLIKAVNAELEYCCLAVMLIICARRWLLSVRKSKRRKSK